MGGVEPGRRLRPRVAARRQARRVGEQAADRPARRRAVRRCVAGGVQLRFEASVCAAIPVIKVLREALVVTNVHRVLGIVNGTTNFVLTEMEAGKSYDEALADAQRAGLRRGRPDRRRDRRGCRREDGDTRDRRVQLARRPDGRRLRRHHRSRRRRRRRRARARHGDPARRRCAARRRQVRRSRPARARRQAASAREGRRRLQRRDAAGRRDPRDHARRPGRRRRRDGLGRDRRHGQRDRDDGHGVPPERRRLAGAAEAAGGRQRSPFYFRLSSRTGRARSRASRTSSRSATSRSRGCSSCRTATAPRCMSSLTKVVPERSTTHSPRSATCPRCTGARGRCP